MNVVKNTLIVMATVAVTVFVLMFILAMISLSMNDDTNFNNQEGEICEIQYPEVEC